MPKKAKKDNKKKSKVKKIPAKAGARARVSKDGKVEVILPVDRSRGKYKPRKTEEQKIKERLEQLRAQERRQYSRDVLAPESISGSYRRGGSIYRSDVQAPTGGFTNLSSIKDQKEDKRLKAVEQKLDKLIEKKQEPKKVEPEPAPAPKPKPIIEEVSTRPLATRRRQATGTPLTGQTVRPQQSRSIVSDIGSGVSALASAGVGLATAGLSGVFTTAERELEAGRERKREADIKRRQEEKERKEKERKQAITDSTQARLKKVDERLKTGSGIADSIMGGERKKIITLRAEPNPERERRELDRRRKALQEEENRKDREHAFKEKERIRREEQQLRQQEKAKAKKDAEDIFSELETAKKDSFYIQPQPRTNIPVATPFIPFRGVDSTDEDDLEDPADVGDTDDEFQSAEELTEEETPTPPPRKPKAPELPPRDEPEPAPALPPRDNDAEQRRKQVLQDQEIARDLLREEARNKDRKLKEAQERANELDKLNRDFIAHKNREDRNERRREQRRKDKENQEIAKRVAGDIINKAEVEEEVEKIVLGGATAGLIEKAPVSAGRGRKTDTDKLIQNGATRQDIQDYEQDNADRKRAVDGIYSAFGINLTGSSGGLDYIKSATSKEKRLQIRRDAIKKLRERGLLVNQIQEFTRTLDRIDELIKRRDDFGNRFQRRGGAVEQRAGRGRGRAGRPRGRGRARGERVGEQVADIEERQDPQPRD